MAKLDRVLELSKRRGDPAQFRSRAEQLISDLNAEIEQARPGVAAELRPIFDQLAEGQKQLALLVGMTAGRVVNAIDDLRNIDKLTSDFEAKISKLIGATLKPMNKRLDEFSDRVLEILRAARADAAPESEEWIFQVHRNESGLIETVVATKRPEGDEIERIDDLMRH